MAEGQPNPETSSSQDCAVQSSQESDILSQETFDMIWRNMSQSTLNSLVVDFADLDNSNIPNEAEQQQLFTEVTGIREEFQSNVSVSENLASSSIHLPSQISTVSSNVQNSSLPACETWSGPFNFTVSFSEQHKNTKGVAWTYSAIKDKLYVKKDAPCPINFSVNSVLPNEGTFIRLMALYTSPEQVSEIVLRCVNHSMEEIKNGRVEAQHLIRCESTTAEYLTDVAGRHSVVVPFENPPAGQEYSTYIYKFACFGSCSGGPNRRPLMLIFTLEAGGQVIGRKKLDVKICACPGRDRKTEDAQCCPAETVNPQTYNPSKRKLETECKALSEVMEFTKSIYTPQPKKKKAVPNKGGIYNVTTDDKECYDFLLHMKAFFKMCKTVKNISPEVLNVAKHLQKVKSERKD